MKEQITALIKSIAPNCHLEIVDRAGFGGDYTRITIAASNYEINRVKGQYPACVSLCLSAGGLTSQIFGGMGGDCIYRLPDKNDPKEKYLALSRVKIPFRKVKNESKFVLPAIERFVTAWKKAIQENIARAPYPDEWKKVLE